MAPSQQWLLSCGTRGPGCTVPWAAGSSPCPGQIHCCWEPSFPQLLSEPGLPTTTENLLVLSTPSLPYKLTLLLLVPSSPLPSSPGVERRCPEQNPYPRAPLHSCPLWQERSSCTAGRHCPRCEKRALQRQAHGSVLCCSSVQVPCPRPRLQLWEAEALQPCELLVGWFPFTSRCQDLVLSIGGACRAKILLKSRRCLWPRCRLCVLVRVDSQVHKPTCLFPRAGRERGPRLRSLSQHPGRGTGRGSSAQSEVLRWFFSAPTTTPGRTDSMSTKGNRRRQTRRAGELLPLDCIDRGGLSLQRKVPLGCNFPAYFYLQQRAGNPERRGYSFQTRSLLGFLSTVKSRATASGSLRSLVFRRL